MHTALRKESVVKSGGVIEIRSPELPVGARVKVIVILESPAPAADALGWPADFFAQFAGSLPDFPEPESEGGYEAREELF